MDVLDLQNEFATTPDDQLHYEVLMNVGSPESGDDFVRVGEIEWQHNEQCIIIQPREEDVV